MNSPKRPRGLDAHRGSSWLLGLVGLIVLTAAVLLYSSDRPQIVRLYLPCPVHAITGYNCPGCGTQRAIHYLLKGNPKAAWQANPLTLIAIPYAALGILVQIRGHRTQSALLLWLRKYLYGLWAAWGWLTVAIIFTIVRNLASHA